jgi:hypothetical protein
MPRSPAPSPSSDDSLDYESTAMRALGPDDMDWDLVHAYFDALDTEAGRAPSGGDPPALAARLTTLGLGAASAAAWHPTVAGALLFGRAPQHPLPQTQVKAARFRGRDVAGLIVDRAELGGPVGPLIESVTQFVARNMRVGGAIEGVYRRDVPEYPTGAVREAVTNAVAHRDYSLAGQKVQVRMFDDRLEIESPGGLAGPVTLDTLEMRRFSRNPRLAQAMYVLRLVEEMGTGIRRIKRALAELGSGPPAFIADRSAFCVTLPALPRARGARRGVRRGRRGGPPPQRRLAARRPQPAPGRGPRARPRHRPPHQPRVPRAARRPQRRGRPPRPRRPRAARLPDEDRLEPRRLLHPARLTLAPPGPPRDAGAGPQRPTAPGRRAA